MKLIFRKVIIPNLTIVFILAFCIYAQNWVAMLGWIYAMFSKVSEYYQNDYTEWLEGDADYWHKKYLEEKYGIQHN